MVIRDARQYKYTIRVRYINRWLDWANALMHNFIRMVDCCFYVCYFLACKLKTCCNEACECTCAIQSRCAPVHSQKHLLSHIHTMNVHKDEDRDKGNWKTELAALFMLHCACREFFFSSCLSEKAWRMIRWRINELRQLYGRVWG